MIDRLKQISRNGMVSSIIVAGAGMVFASGLFQADLGWLPAAAMALGVLLFLVCAGVYASITYRHRRRG